MKKREGAVFRTLGIICLFFTFQAAAVNPSPDSAQQSWPCRSVLMVRPSQFGFNSAAAKTNAFQCDLSAYDADHIQAQALHEFDQYADRLRGCGVDVWVFTDTSLEATPDSIFPNNWFSVHPDGTMITYPMLVLNRRQERRADIVDWVKDNFVISHSYDLSAYEGVGQYLEGTGSIVFDHDSRVAYACHSPRTHAQLFEQLCHALEYRGVLFHARDPQGIDIYHTNVMMALGTDFAVICLEAISDSQERAALVSSCESTGHAVLAITMDQLECFCGNILELANSEGKRFIVMSDQAYEAFTPSQRQFLEERASIVHSPLDTIERVGGGGARCMLAGIHAIPRQSGLTARARDPGQYPGIQCDAEGSDA